MTRQFSKLQVATAIAIIFHAVGIIGILVFKSSLIISATPINMLLSFGLIIWTQEQKNTAFWIFIAACVGVGIIVEIIGVNTGFLFGNYQYGSVLGPQLAKVPLLIGINWFITIYCCAVCVYSLLQRMIPPADSKGIKPPQALKALALITDGATLAVLFDWLMEPVAVKLKFWAWEGNTIPVFNYVCWFTVSALLLLVFNACRFHRQNKFAVHLFLIQVMFFLLLRTFLQ